MSKVKIEGNASGTGTLTIAAPNTNTDRTLTLPDGAGELLTTTGDGSQLTGITSPAILQVQSTSIASTVSASAANTNTLMGTVSITPSSTSSKILITTSMVFKLSGADTMYASYYIHRDTTKITEGFDGSTGDWTHTDYGGDQKGTCTLTHIDSPSTTSSIDYKVYFRTTATSDKIGVAVKTDIIAMEIAG